ncbi:hypothetical protein AFCDBAGC_1288 [Methylobacterium cerastii]|uniref:Stability/partitioning determinant n=1 Tax=Methylobacterium cerastii TaxID=932741 RepID=A0ABQ4QEA4_9HYPH|nr:hypothetical protein [Methylobacterium cerastii]GJD43436.1 hypothetical protein AFCDBAGC_1288 [Methylobacterium cerastii]
MAAKPRNRASLDADAVARMMREQDEPAEASAPEIPPVASEPEPAVASPVLAGPAVLTPRETPAFDPGKVDGRTLRRTGREPFATRIKPETHEALRRIAYHRRITIAEALELAVAAYDAARKLPA